MSLFLALTTLNILGESIPVNKIPLPQFPSDQIYNDKEHSRHTLYCGTEVIQTRYYGGSQVLAVVIRTGFSTSKGGLVRSIMFPHPVDFEFNTDSYRFILVLVGIAMIGFIWTVATKVGQLCAVVLSLK